MFQNNIIKVGDNMYDTIIIGAGPAGLTSALYLLRANKKVLVLESKNYGGQILNAHKVENYPGIMSISGFDFANNLYNQVKKLGCELKYETALKITNDKKVITNKAEYQGKTIIIATGASNRQLNIPNEQEFIGKGISYCATCDGNFFKNKTVAVLGGGNTALEDALYLTNIAQKVYLIHRRSEFRGEEKILNELKNKDNIIFTLNYNVVSLNGQDCLESITIKNNEGNTKEIKIDGLFIAIGQVPKNEVFNNIVDIDNNGYILTHDEVYTKTEGVFVAGDNRVKDLRQLTTAVSDGSLASLAVLKYLK